MVSFGNNSFHLTQGLGVSDAITLWGIRKQSYRLFFEQKRR